MLVSFSTPVTHMRQVKPNSLHLVLPETEARQVIVQGWGEFYPLVLQGVMPPTYIPSLPLTGRWTSLSRRSRTPLLRGPTATGRRESCLTDWRP